MPATMVHALFANDVYDILPKNYRNKLSISRCKMFAQSTDSCFFYNLFSFMPGKKIRSFQKYFHENQTQEFFINLLKFIKDNDIDDTDTLSFLFGFITHYVLDSIVHPYIIYKTGYFDKNKPETYKYNSIHHFMEIFLDNDMIYRRFNVNPYKYDISSFCFDTRKFSNDLSKTINYSFFNTFQIKNMNSIYYKSLIQMKYSIKYLRQDSYGIKRFIYKFLDSFTTKKTFRLESISYHYPLDDKYNFLNSNNSLWRYPTDYNLCSNESFIDLYLKAIREAKVIICACFDYLNGRNIDLEKIFDNKSYVTGINCNDKKEMKYFEF